ncbi:MAG: hypothetical protein ABI947_24015 [Chloroflexota bacterium]
MTTNSRTWFYNEPEHRPYYIEERVNQNLWATRLGSIYLDCVRAEPPFRMEGVWNGITVSIEWVPNKWFILHTTKEDRTLIGAFAQILQFPPTLSFEDETGAFIAEWHRTDAAKRLQELQGHPNYTNVKTYKR